LATTTTQTTRRRHFPGTNMADKRRSGGTSVLLSEAKNSSASSTTSTSTSRSESDRLLLSQLGVGELLRGAILKMVEARSDDPIGFLADHFCNLAASSAVVSVGGGGGGSDGDQVDGVRPSACAQEQQRLNRALWHLRLAHHSQRFG